MKRGFTLVELSIVLVIIGLLIGGILVAQSMITTTKVLTTTKDIAQYQILVSHFKQTYKYLPGDLPNAYSYFGAACGPDYVKTGVPFQADGCNGDGNGIISAAHPANGDNALLHLSISKIFPKTLTNLQTDQRYILDGNVPKGAFSQSFYFITEANDGTGYIAPYLIYLYGLNSNTPTTTLPAIPPAVTLAIDTKMDDGLADNGLVRTSLWHGSSSGCSSGGTYMVNTTANACSPAFIPPEQYQ